MRVLLLHNRYREPGGEDAVVRSEAALLRSHGVEVRDASFDNEPGASALHDALQLGLRSSWSRESYREVLQLCRGFRPDVVHVHNFWMRLTPSVHAASRQFGAPTVQTLHNLEAILAGCGCTLADVIKVNVYLTDMSQFGAMNEAYLSVFGADPPARITTGCTALALGAGVEMDCVAIAPS